MRPLYQSVLVGGDARRSNLLYGGVFSRTSVEGWS